MIIVGGPGCGQAGLVQAKLTVKKRLRHMMSACQALQRRGDTLTKVLHGFPSWV